MDGQLNALILPDGEAPQFQWESYDGLPTATALDRQLPSPDPINIRWSENPVEVPGTRGAEFSRCRHLASGRVLDILHRLSLRAGWSHPLARTSTDYFLPGGSRGIPSLLCAHLPGYLAKKNGVTGWYAGRLGQ